MASIIWVDSEGTGDDSQNGSSLLLAKRTLSNAISAMAVAGTGSTLNVVARATSYPVTALGPLVSSLAGTSYTSFGFRIRGVVGVGSSEVPAHARVTWTSSNPMMRLGSGTRYGLLQFLEFDRTTGFSSTSQNVVRIDNTATGPTRFEYCISRHAHTPARTGVELQTNLSNVVSFGDIRYCYYPVSVDILNSFTLGFDTNESNASALSFNHNVVVTSGTGGVARIITRGTSGTEGAATNHDLTNNTFVTLTGAITQIWSTTITANVAAIKNMHSNIWVNFGTSTNNRIFEGNTGLATYTGTKIVGYNLFSDVSTGVTWAASRPYQIPWDEDNFDGPPYDTGVFWSTDVVDPANPLNAYATPWTWNNINGSGIDIVLPGDYRLAIHRTSGYGGIVPGAIADGIAVAVDDSYTFYNNVATSVAAPGVLGNDTDVGTGTADLVSNVDPAAGSVSLAANGSFVFTPAAGYDGTASFTYRIDQGGGTYSNTATVALTIVSPVPVLPFGLPIGPDSPGFLFETPEGAGASIRLARNVVLEAKQLVSFVREQITHVGGGSAEIPTATALAAVPTLSGSRVLILESDGAATVRLNSVDVPLLAGGCVLLCGADLSAILVTNDHPVRPAVVRYFGGK